MKCGLGYLAFREIPTLGVLLGGCIVLVGVVIAILGKASLSWQRLKSMGFQWVSLCRKQPVMGWHQRELEAIAQQPPLHSQRKLQQSVAYRNRPNYLADQDRMGDL